LGEDRLKITFKQSAGVLEVLFGVGFGYGNALKCFVENADNPLLFGFRFWVCEFNLSDFL